MPMPQTLISKMADITKAIKATMTNTMTISTKNRELLASNTTKVKEDVVVMILKKSLRHLATSL